jgi:hypothetical protein
MNLQEQYKKLFKGRASSNDKKLLSEALAWERVPGKPLPTLKDVTEKFNKSVNEGKYDSNTDADDIFFLWDETVDDDRRGIEHSHGAGHSRRYSQFIFDDAVRGYDEFQENAESLLIKNKWEYDWDGDILNIYE